jgi:hypothetical protein
VHFIPQECTIFLNVDPKDQTASSLPCDSHLDGLLHGQRSTKNAQHWNCTSNNFGFWQWIATAHDILREKSLRSLAITATPI